MLFVAGHVGNLIPVLAITAVLWVGEKVQRGRASATLKRKLSLPKCGTASQLTRRGVSRMDKIFSNAAVRLPRPVPGKPEATCGTRELIPYEISRLGHSVDTEIVCMHTPVHTARQRAIQRESWQR